MSRGIKIAALIGLLLALAAPTAEAKGKKKKKRPGVVVRTATVTSSADNQAVSAVAICPKRTIALGGGFQAPISREGAQLRNFTVVHESRRTGLRTWGVSGVREDGGAAGPALTLTASVHCRSPRIGKRKKGRKPKLIEVTEVPASGGPGGDSAVLTATASCPPGLRLLGGGFRVTPDPVPTGAQGFASTFQSTPINSFSWQASAVNRGAVSRAATSYAYCITGREPVINQATGELPGGDSTPGEGAAAAQVCPGKRTLIGGGFSHERTPTFAPVTFESYALNGEWRAAAWNPGAESGNLSSTGICL